MRRYKYQRTHRFIPVETFETRSAPILIIDLVVLRHLKERDDETPETVIHRVLGEHNKLKSGVATAAHRYIDDLNTIIANQSKQLTSFRQELDERDDFIGKQSATIDELKGKLVLANLKGDEPPDGGVHGKRRTTVNIIITPCD